MLDVIISLGLAPIVRSLVAYLKPAWSGAPEKLSPVINTLVASILGIALSFAWQLYENTGASVELTVALGFLSGVGAILYNDYRAPKEEDREASQAAGAIVPKARAAKARRRKPTKKEKANATVGSKTPQK